MMTFAINAGIILANTVATAVIGVSTKQILKKKISGKVDSNDFETTEEYTKAVNKANRKVALISTAVTAASSVGLSCGSAYILGELNAPQIEDTTGDNE